MIRKIAAKISSFGDMLKVILGKVIQYNIMNKTNPLPAPTNDPS